MVIYPIDIYNKVVLWYRLIIMLILICIFDLKLHDIDFINTFYQAEQKGQPLYMACYPWFEMGSYEVMLLNNIL